MAKDRIISREARGLIAALDERGNQIRELERQIETQATLLAEKDRQIAYMRQQSDDFQAHWERALTENGKLKALIPTLDGTADRKAREIAEATVRVREGQLSDMVETIAYLRGWCAKSLGREPQLTDPDFREVPKTGDVNGCNTWER